MLLALARSAVRRHRRCSNAAPQLVHTAVVDLEPQCLELPNREPLKLTPGMAATIEIHQGRRTVMEYLLRPV